MEDRLVHPSGRISRVLLDAAEYKAELQRSCFICDIGDGSDRSRDLVYEDPIHLVFLPRYPALWGHTLVAPREHRERVTGDFGPSDYLRLQDLVFKVGEAVRRTVETERLYLMSMGSQQGVRHVHWHVAPLPPGVPFENQQFEVFKSEAGVMDIPPEERALLARAIASSLKEVMRLAEE